MRTVKLSNGMVIQVWDNIATLWQGTNVLKSISRDGRDSINSAVDQAIEDALRNSNGQVTVISDTKGTRYYE
jgi:hypothetical protein